MLKVFYGTDQTTVRTQAHLAIDEAVLDGKDFVRLEADSYEAGALWAFSSSTSLFSKENVYLIDTPSVSDIFYTEFLENVEALATSNNVFVAILESLTAADKKQITKYATLVEEYKETTSATFNPFKMADALAAKDKRSLWLLLQEAKANQLSAEEIIGTLWWQLKAIRLAATTKTAAEAGMKDYPYKKAKGALRSFPLSEVEKKSRLLLELYHAGHRGKRDLDLALEEWVLKL